MVFVMAAYRVRVIGETAIQICQNRLICVATDTGIQFDSRLCKRLSRTLSDPPQIRTFTAFSARKSASAPCPLPLVSATLRRNHLSVLCLIHLEFLRMSKMLKNLSIFIRDCYFHHIFLLLYSVVFCSARSRILCYRLRTERNPLRPHKALSLNQTLRQFSACAVIDRLHGGTGDSPYCVHTLPDSFLRNQSV